MFRRLPTWLSRRDLPLPRFRQAKHLLALIVPRPDVDPPLLAQQGQRTCKRGAIHGKAGTQRFLVSLADNGEGGEQAELGDFDSGLAELLVVNAGHKSGGAPKVLTRARESKERVRGMIVVNRHNHKMYIHVILVCVKKRGQRREDSVPGQDLKRVTLCRRRMSEFWGAAGLEGLGDFLLARKARGDFLIGGSREGFDGGARREKPLAEEEALKIASVLLLFSGPLSARL